MADYSALNPGIIRHRVAAAKGRAGAKRTIVVTGVARSGTSLVAAVLRAAGLPMGETVYDVVNEDAHMLEVVRSRDPALLQALIRTRNAKHATWGFKIPNLHVYLRHDELNLFRNPHLIVICRDPVAVAMRNVLSEHIGPLSGFTDATNAMQAMAHFVDLATCPVLLLSYEKVIAYPSLLIDSVLDFCGLPIDAAGRAALQTQIKPNNPDYLAVATRRFRGRIDGIRDGALFGWCYEENRLEPVHLELWAGERLLEPVIAGGYRADLAAGGIGNGCHGFSVDLDRHRLPAGTAIRIKIAGRLLELENSGRRLDSWNAMADAG